MVGRDEGVALGSVAPVRLMESLIERWVRLTFALHPPDSTDRFEPADPLGGKRTGEPVSSGEWRAVLENRRDSCDSWEAEVAASGNRRIAPKRASDLSPHHIDVAHSETRSAPVT